MVTLLSRSSVVVRAEDMPESMLDAIEEISETPDDESEEAGLQEETETDIVELESEAMDQPEIQEAEQEVEETPEEDQNQQTDSIVEEQPDGESIPESEIPKEEETDKIQEDIDKTDEVTSEDEADTVDTDTEDKTKTDHTILENGDRTDNAVSEKETEANNDVSENEITEDVAMPEGENNIETNETEELQPDIEIVPEDKKSEEETDIEENYHAKYEDAHVIIYAEAEKGVLPEGTELSVTPIVQTEITDDLSEEDRVKAEKINAQYDLTSQKLEEEAEYKGETVTEVVAYDICFLLEGEKVEPTQKVDLMMEFQDTIFSDDTEEGSNISIYHLKEDAEEEDGIKAEDLTEDTILNRAEDNNGVEKVELATDSFSIFAFVRTVIADNTYKAEYKDDRVVISVEAAEGVVPEGAELSVTPVERIEITEDMSEEEIEKAEALNEQYDFANQKLSEEAQAKDKVVTGFVAYDICFLVEGEEVEPNGQVKVTMEFIDAVLSEEKAEDSSVSLYHFKEVAEEEDSIKVEDLTEGAMIQKAEEKTGIEKVEVMMDSFSLTALVDEASPQPLTRVDTVDSSKYITINMIDYENGDDTNGYSAAAPFAPSNANNYELTQGILSPTFELETEKEKEEGKYNYPTFTDKKPTWGNIDKFVDAYTKESLVGQSFGRYFGQSSTEGVGKKITAKNSLFIKSYYDKEDTKGYYHYASTENGVSFNTTTKEFEVYEELTTTSDAKGVTTEIGNFVPLNTFDKGKIATNITNQYDMSFKELGSDDPQKGKALYLPVEDTNFHYGMEMLTEFYQREGGKDTNENDTIFKFTGDDDLWIYIDGVLVLDLGGCHRAMSGSINFATGIVEVEQAVPDYPNVKEGEPKIDKKSLRKIFEDAKATGRTTWKGETFADYTTHDFRMWYMERGEGAANLKLEFNLSVIPKDSLTVKKEIKNTENQDYLKDEEFEFRVMAQELANTDTTGKEHYTANFTPVTKVTDSNIKFDQDGFFKIKNGETVIFPDFQQDRKYYVEERVDHEKFATAQINSEGSVSAVQDSEGRYIITSSRANNGDRPSVVFANQCVPRELQISKKVDANTILPGQEKDFYKITVQYGKEGAWENYKGKYYVNGTGKTASVDGEIEVKAGETAILKGLIKGMSYRIFENDKGKFTEIPSYQATGGGTSEVEVLIDGSDYQGLQGMMPAGNVSVAVTNANLKDIHIAKKWIDNKDALQKRPDSITVQLEYRLVGSSNDSDWKAYDKDQQHPNGEWKLIPTSEQKSAEEWSLKIEGLPSIYEYRVKEIKVGDIAVESSSYLLSVIQESSKGSGENNNIYTSSIQNSLKWQMVKCSSTDHDVKLEGAEFDLLKGDQCIAKGTSGSDGVLEWKSADGAQTFDWKTLEKDITYTISETKARPGYAMTSWTMTLENGFPTSIKDGKGNNIPTNKGDKNNPTAIFYLENDVLYELPSTGGTGILGYLFSGVMLMMVSVLFMYRKKYAGRC